jgi:hypothetical protein
LIVVPIGKLKSTTSSDSFALFLATDIDNHIVALLDAVENQTRTASFTFQKYLNGSNPQIRNQIKGRTTQAWINNANKITTTNGIKSNIALEPFSTTTFITIANTPNGVNLITNSINFNIASLRVVNISFTTFTFFTFQSASNDIHKIIPQVTICIALNSTNAVNILLGIRSCKNWVNDNS